MRLLIFGATGQTGRQLIAQGLQQGHIITAFVRRQNSLLNSYQNLVVIQGDISNTQQVAKAIKDQDAVISVLGNKTSQALWKSNTIISDGLKNIIHNMKVSKVKRLVFVTSFGIGDNIFFPEKLFIRIILKNIFADISTQEKLIEDSGLDYTIVRPTRLFNAGKTGKYKADVNLPIGLFSKIARSDVADFILKSLKNRNFIKKIITLSY